eukprot:7390262-Prymnesium_polylepis.1
MYQPGFHLLSDRTGKERCVGSQMRTSGGTYWHYFTLLPGAAGESVIFNTKGDAQRLESALNLMCSTSLCEHEVA